MFEKRYRAYSVTEGGKDELEHGEGGGRGMCGSRCRGGGGCCSSTFQPACPLLAPAPPPMPRRPLCAFHRAVHYSPAGDKIVLPDTALAILTSMAVQYPMQFRVTCDATGKSTHVGVSEFSAPEGRAYIPRWVLDGLGAGSGSFVTIRNVRLRKATYVKFQPHSKTFLDISNPKAILERKLRTYSALTKGDTLVFSYLDTRHALDVLELKPDVSGGHAVGAALRSGGWLLPAQKPPLIACAPLTVLCCSAPGTGTSAERVLHRGNGLRGGLRRAKGHASGGGGCQWRW